MLKIIIEILLLIQILVILYYGNKEKNYLTITNFIFLAMDFLYFFPVIFSIDNWTENYKFLFLIILGYISIFITIFILKNKKIYIKTSKYNLDNKRINIFYYIITLYYFVGFLNIPFYSYSKFIEFLLRDRVGVYLSNPLERNSILMTYFIDILGSIISCYYIKNKKKRGYFLLLIIIFSRICFSHTRLVIISEILTLLFYYNYNKKKLEIKKLIIFFMLTLSFISIGNFARGGNLKGNIKKAISAEVILKQAFRATAGSTKSFYLLYKKNPEIEYGKQYYKYLPLSVIPRKIWKNKPITSYFWRATKVIKGEFPNGKKNPVLTTTYFGEAYHEFGTLGLIFFPPIYVYILLLSIKFLKKFEYTDFLIYKFILHIGMDLRGGLNSFIIRILMYIGTFILFYFIFYDFKKKSTEIKRIRINNFF